MSAVIPPGRWDDPHHDVELLQEALRDCPLAPAQKNALFVIAGCGHEHTAAVIGLLDMVGSGAVLAAFAANHHHLSVQSAAGGRWMLLCSGCHTAIRSSEQECWLYAMAHVASGACVHHGGDPR